MQTATRSPSGITRSARLPHAARKPVVRPHRGGGGASSQGRLAAARRDLQTRSRARPTARIGESGDGAVAWVHDIGRDRVVQAVYRDGPTGTCPRQAISRRRASRSGIFTSQSTERVTRSPSGQSAARPPSRSRPRHVRPRAAPGDPGHAFEPRRRRFGRTEHRGRTERCRHRRVGRERLRGQGRARQRGHRWMDVGRGRVAPGPGAGSRARRHECGRRRRRRLDPAACRQLAATRPCRLRVGSGTWDAPFDFPTVTSAPATESDVAVDGTGNVVVTWVADARVEAGSRSAASGTWAGPVLVSTLDGASAPRLAVDPRGNTVTVWTSGTGMVQAALRPGATGLWGRSIDVSRPEASSPRVTVDASGSGLAVWNERAAENTVVKSARLDGNRAVLTQLRVPRRAAAHTATPFVAVFVPWAAPLSDVARWTFGDGASAVGARVAHSYARFGRYEVVVVQTDTAGKTSTATRTIVVGAPRNTIRPSIRGRVGLGRTLTCRPGSWGGARPIRFTYRWLRDGDEIARATRSRYRLRLDDRGLLGCRVRATNALGPAEASARPVHVG